MKMVSEFNRFYIITIIFFVMICSGSAILFFTGVIGKVSFMILFSIFLLFAGMFIGSFVDSISLKNKITQNLPKDTLMPLKGQVHFEGVIYLFIKDLKIKGVYFKKNSLDRLDNLLPFKKDVELILGEKDN